MSNSIRAILDVAMTFFPPCISNANSEASLTLQRAIEQFLQRKLSYDQMCAISQKIAGTSQPIERLNKILETSPDPIPVPDEIRNKNYKGSRRKTRAWTQYEDQRLLAGIYRNGIENWTSISKFVGNARTRSQCSQRWYRGLDPAICKDQWTKEEEQKLIDLINTHGDKSWTKIASKMGNRSDVQCRYKYRQLQKEEIKEGKILTIDMPKRPIEEDSQEEYERPAVRRLNKSALNNLNSKKQNKFVNQNPSLLIAQNLPIQASINQHQIVQLHPCHVYPQQCLPTSPYVSPSSSVASGLVQTPSAQIVIQNSQPPQSLQQNFQFSRQIGENNVHPQQIQIIQQPHPIQSIHQPPLIQQIHQPIHPIQTQQPIQQIAQVQPIRISQVQSIQQIPQVQPIQQIHTAQPLPIHQPIQISQPILQIQQPGSIQMHIPQEMQFSQPVKHQFSQQIQPHQIEQPLFHIQKV